MKEKQWDPARNNEQSPAPGLAAVNTHNPEEETPIEEIYNPENARQEESRQHEGAIPEHQGEDRVTEAGANTEQGTRNDE